MMSMAPSRTIRSRLAPASAMPSAPRRARSATIERLLVLLAQLLPDRHRLPGGRPLAELVHLGDPVGEEVGAGLDPLLALGLRERDELHAVLGEEDARLLLGVADRLQVPLVGLLRHRQHHL